ncbi:phage head completion protein [Neptunicoccus sediminis]|uniref:phage head completion protein n=1 Tax=Neptunicoccus sediminis TaxID=1892596 RepID=UPI0009F6797D|nr:head-tail adaptor protein [Neptunicoccus sediminis]
MKIKATFYRPTITKNEYQEDVKAWGLEFSTGVDVKTVSFKDKLANQQSVSDESILVYCRKNSNSLSIKSGWQARFTDNSIFEVSGIDSAKGKMGELILFCERVKDGTV